MAALNKGQPSPLGEFIVRRLWAVLAEVCPDESRSIPLSDAHLRRLYMEQHNFLRKECQAATERTFILSDLVGAETTFFDVLTASARRRELDRAVEKERLEWYDLERRQSRLRNELNAVGLTLGHHPATGEWGIRTVQEQWGHRNETGSEDTESVLCAGASAAVHVRLRPSRSAHPQHYD